MSTEDLKMVGQVLMGITNPDKQIRTQAVNKLQELRQNLGALTYCLLEIAQLPLNTPQDQLIKTTALVICRKILDSDEIEDWKKIDNNLKNQIKLKSLELFINESQENQKAKICDVITQIIDKVSDCEEDWDDLKKLSLTVLNLNPSDENNLIQINSLLKLLTDGTGFLYDMLKENFNKLIPYLISIFQNNQLKLKVTASNFISELIAFCDKEDLKDLKNLLFNILQATLECFTNNKEDYLKDLLQIIIEMCSVEPKLFKPHFQDIFTLCKKIIEKKDFADEKIRELSFEVIVNLIEEQPDLLKKRKEDLKILFEMIYKYSLEMDKEIDSSWYNPNGNNYNEIDVIEEENVNFSQGLIERLVESLGLDETESLLTELINNLINQNDWVYKYIGLFSFTSLTSFEEEDMSNVEMAFPLIFSLTKFNHPKVKFSAIHCINKLCDNYNPNFQKKYITQVFPLLFEIFPNETILRIQCEIIETFSSFIQFTSSENLMPYVSQILDILFNLFINEIPLILRRAVIECILEVFCTIEKQSEPYAKKCFDIILNYFVELYKSKSNKILYGGLIECITTIGPYTKDDFYKVIPDIVKCIIDLVQGINFDNDPIRAELQNSIERLLPILQNDFKDLLPNLISVVLALIKIKPKASISSNPEKEIDVNELLSNEKEDNLNKKKYDIHSSDTEDFAGSLSLLNTIIESLDNEFLPYVNEVEKEIIPLLINGITHKIRNKSAKILANLISIIKDNNLKKEKGILYIQSLISAIEKETDHHTCEKLFIHLGEVIDNSGEILQKNELNELFKKIMTFFQNLEKKRLNLVSKQENKKTTKKGNEDDISEGNLSELIDEDIENIQNIQSEISDLIGILFKTHKQISGDIINIILNEFLPKFSKSTSNFELKMALFITDDLIEYLGQEMLNNVWNDLYNLITTLCIKKDDEIRQAAAYGIGIFAKFTKIDFDKYAEGLLNSLKEGLKISPNEDNEESWGLAHDNLIASIGKILFYQSNSEIVKKYLNELIDVWINNLPIKYDTIEQEQQHEWLCDFILNKNELINEKWYNNIFKTLAFIYDSKSSNDNINQKILKIFEGVKNNEKMKNIVQDVYNNAESKIKNKLENLIK